ncbi:MAG TPA: hypothetical protein VL308_12960 [Gemmatimonadaceae bacterium]|jgi:hypothetical protein|nr:hypothetical protein [Gemmatimonadaceae bacterium]
MSERRKTHNGRDISGNFKVKQADVDDLETDPDGADIIRDDVRLGGAVEDTGATAGQLGEHVSELVDENRENVDRVTGRRPGRHNRSR